MSAIWLSYLIALRALWARIAAINTANCINCLAKVTNESLIYPIYLV